MYEYPDHDRKAVLQRAGSQKYQERYVDMAFAYSVYDVMRLQLECLGKIEEMMEGMCDVVQKRDM